MAAKLKRRKEMFHLVELWKSSRMSRNNFCEQHNLRRTTFYYWVKKYEREIQQVSSDFVALEVNKEEPVFASNISLEYPNGIKVHLSEQIELSTLKKLINLV